MTEWLVLGFIACAVISAVLIASTGRKAWEGALLGLVFGPVGVVVALVVAIKRPQRT